MKTSGKGAPSPSEQVLVIQKLVVQVCPHWPTVARHLLNQGWFLVP